MNRHDIISLGHTLEQDENAASDLWTWLPSYRVAQQHHGDYAANFRPSVSDIMKEAAMVLAEQKGHEHSEAERREWFEKCPCDEGCETPLVFVYVDISGSCVADNPLQTISKVSKATANLRAFAFGTEVKEHDHPKLERIGFGGTQFDIIETHIQKMIKDEDIPRYPDVVIVYTDGYGTVVMPEHPDRWHWCIIKNGDKSLVPQGSVVREQMDTSALEEFIRDEEWKNERVASSMAEHRTFKR